MKQNAKNDRPFTLNSHVLERVKSWKNLVSKDRDSDEVGFILN
jgi:CRISPR-associated protein Cas1